ISRGGGGWPGTAPSRRWRTPPAAPSASPGDWGVGSPGLTGPGGAPAGAPEEKGTASPRPSVPPAAPSAGPSLSLRSGPSPSPHRSHPPSADEDASASATPGRRRARRESVALSQQPAGL